MRRQRMKEARQKRRHTKAEWEALVKVCGNKCVRCEYQGSLVKDHIIPIYQGGSDGIDNIQPMCGFCNGSKGPEDIDFRPDYWRAALDIEMGKLPPAHVLEARARHAAHRDMLAD